MMSSIGTSILFVKYVKDSRGADMSIVMGFCFNLTGIKLGSP